MAKAGAGPRRDVHGAALDPPGRAYCGARRANGIRALFAPGRDGPARRDVGRGHAHCVAPFLDGARGGPDRGAEPGARCRIRHPRRVGAAQRSLRRVVRAPGPRLSLSAAHLGRHPCGRRPQRRRCEEATMSATTTQETNGALRGTRRYTVLLTPEVEDGGYSVTVPALPGCHTQGDTLEEALANAREAIRLYLEDVIASGEPIPEERGRPELAEVEV